MLKQKYQNVAENINAAKNPEKIIQEAEDKLSFKIAKADENFIARINKVSKSLEKEESLSLVNSGWVNENVYSKGFVNHGQRVKTYVEIAKSKDLPAHVGALQANFGNIYETGINDLNNQIENLNTQLIDLDQSTDEAKVITSRLETLNQELETIIENVKPGLKVESGWETINLDSNNDGVINIDDIQS